MPMKVDTTSDRQFERALAMSPRDFSVQDDMLFWNRPKRTTWPEIDVRVTGKFEISSPCGPGVIDISGPEVTIAEILREWLTIRRESRERDRSQYDGDETRSERDGRSGEDDAWTADESDGQSWGDPVRSVDDSDGDVSSGWAHVGGRGCGGARRRPDWQRYGNPDGRTYHKSAINSD